MIIIPSLYKRCYQSPRQRGDDSPREKTTELWEEIVTDELIYRIERSDSAHPRPRPRHIKRNVERKFWLGFFLEIGIGLHSEQFVAILKIWPSGHRGDEIEDRGRRQAGDRGSWPESDHHSLARQVAGESCACR